MDHQRHLRAKTIGCAKPGMEIFGNKLPKSGVPGCGVTIPLPRMGLAIPPSDDRFKISGLFQVSHVVPGKLARLEDRAVFLKFVQFFEGFGQ